MAQSIRDDDGVSNLSGNPHLTELVETAIARNPARRSFLKTGLGAALLPFIGGVAACSDNDEQQVVESILGFKSVPTGSADVMVVPEGYRAETLVRWGDPLLAGAPEFRGDASETSFEAELQVGDNHDGMHYFGFKNADGSEKSDSGLLAINHEYINPEYYYAPGTDPANWLLPFTAEKARKALAGHGITVVEVRRKADGSWEYVRGSHLQPPHHGLHAHRDHRPGARPRPAQDGRGPERGRGAGHAQQLRERAGRPGAPTSPARRTSTATSAGTARTRRTPLENRYGIAKDGFGYLWHTVDPRFDVTANPNEPNRFGWVVEIDPSNPASKPKKRTALGRFKHENAELVVAPNGKVVVYLGCDERNEYIYKFVSAGTYNPANAAANANLLDTGTLYVGKFEAGATAGDHMGDGQLGAARLRQQRAGCRERLHEPGRRAHPRAPGRRPRGRDDDGPPRVDRGEPEEGGRDLHRAHQQQPPRHRARFREQGGRHHGSRFRPPRRWTMPNPRADNQWGHVLRWNETGGDPTADDLLLGHLRGRRQPEGDARPHEPASSGSANVTVENMFNSPDGLQFDASGRLWIQTDGSFANTGNFDGQGNNQMLAADIASGEIRRFLVGPSGCEVTGVTWTAGPPHDVRQHPAPGRAGQPPQPAQEGRRLASTATTTSRATRPGSRSFRRRTTRRPWATRRGRGRARSSCGARTAGWWGPDPHPSPLPREREPFSPLSLGRGAGGEGYASFGYPTVCAKATNWSWSRRMARASFG